MWLGASPQPRLRLTSLVRPVTTNVVDRSVWRRLQQQQYLLASLGRSYPNLRFCSCLIERSASYTFDFPHAVPAVLHRVEEVINLVIGKPQL